MATLTFQPDYSLFDNIRNFKRRVTARGLWFGMILLGALVAFEIFNFSTTDYALVTLFGQRDALGVATWAKVLAIAFCGIDFAGLSRLFTPETGRKEPKEIWLLTGAWFLGAGMNAIMTWWAVGSALSDNPLLGNELLSRADVLHYGPIFIAGLVWLTRVLIIGTFAFAGDHIFSTAYRAKSGAVVNGTARPTPRTTIPPAEPRAVPKPSQSRSLPERTAPLESSSYARQSDYGSSQRRYESQSSFFGHGAGASRGSGSQQSSRDTFRPAAARTGSPIGYSATADTRNSAAMAGESAPARRMSSARPVEPVPGAPAVVEEPAPSRVNTGPSTRSMSNPFKPAAFTNRASTTRTVSSPRSVSEADAASDGPGDDPESTSMELEYVDFD